MRPRSPRRRPWISARRRPVLHPHRKALAVRFGRSWAAGPVAFILSVWPLAQAEVAVPPLNARVTDLTNTLNAGERASLEQTLQAFEARKGSQIAVLMVASTQPESIEQYSIRVVEQWR